MKSVVLRWCGILSVVTLLPACGGKVPLLPPDPTIARFQIVADANVNPDSKGRATPVVVRYYVLANPAAFEGADFFSLFDGDEKVLGATLVAREELTLRPGQTASTDIKPQAEAKAVAVFVAFRDVNKSVWRATAVLAPNKTNIYNVRVQKDRVSLLGGAK